MKPRFELALRRRRTPRGVPPAAFGSRPFLPAVLGKVDRAPARAAAASRASEQARCRARAPPVALEPSPQRSNNVRAIVVHGIPSTHWFGDASASSSDSSMRTPSKRTPAVPRDAHDDRVDGEAGNVAATRPHSCAREPRRHRQARHGHHCSLTRRLDRACDSVDASSDPMQASSRPSMLDRLHAEAERRCLYVCDEPVLRGSERFHAPVDHRRTLRTPWDTFPADPPLGFRREPSTPPRGCKSRRKEVRGWDGVGGARGVAIRFRPWRRTLTRPSSWRRAKA